MQIGTRLRISNEQMFAIAIAIEVRHEHRASHEITLRLRSIKLKTSTAEQANVRALKGTIGLKE